jgi:hypothetical protein
MIVFNPIWRRIVLKFSILLHSYLTHSLTSVYNANTAFSFKCHLQYHLKFVKKVIKITFSVYLLQNVSVSQGHRQATVNCMGSHVSVFTSYYCMSSYSRMYTRTFLMLFPCCGVHFAFTYAYFSRSDLCPLYCFCIIIVVDELALGNLFFFFLVSSVFLC